jgi:sulfatase maturation enzyme AslB (radical SAM superfamily)
MEKLIEHMIQIVESNAKDNKATIPDVEAWAIAWREEASKLQGHSWMEIWSEWIKQDTKFGVVNFLDYLKENYHPPVKKQYDEA